MKLLTRGGRRKEEEEEEGGGKGEGTYLKFPNPKSAVSRAGDVGEGASWM
jgi:hypothetical protein